MIRSIEFRFVLVRNGADYGLLNPAAGSTPVIRMDANASVKTSLSGSFADTDMANWLTDRIRAEIVLDGIPHAAGLFIPASVQWLETETSKVISVEAYDQCWLVEDTKTETILHLDAGSNYIDVIETLLAQAGIALMIRTATPATLAEDREDWDIGTSYLDIINQLLSEINYNPLWFNSSGAAILEPASVPTADHIEHVINSDDPGCMMAPPVTKEVDVFNAPNVFLCICSNADKSGVMTATAENTNPQSPLSIARRGRRIVRVERLDNIADQTELQAYADRLRNESMSTGEVFYIQTALQPGHGVNDVVALHHGDETSICLERSWSMNLGPGGTMSHDLEKVVYNLG